MKKALCIVAAVVAFVFLVSGCSVFPSKHLLSQIRSESKDNSSNATYDFKFSSKDESESHTLDLQENGSILITFKSTVKKGKVYFTLEDDEEKIIHEDSGKRMSFNEAFSLDEGLYKITLKYAKAEKGNLKLEIYSDSYFEYYNGKDDEDK